MGDLEKPFFYSHVIKWHAQKSGVELEQMDIDELEEYCQRYVERHNADNTDVASKDLLDVKEFLIEKKETAS